MIVEPDDYPLATEFVVGESLLALKEISPRVPQGSVGRVVAILEATNEVHIAWVTPSGEKITKASPAHSWKRIDS